jgi:nucleotide-binding universal stress UspA family protein
MASKMSPIAAARESQPWGDKVKAGGVEVETTVSPSALADTIARTAEEIGADLVVMGSRGLTGPTHVLLGSAAERTLRTTPCAVLTVKDGDVA